MMKSNRKTRLPYSINEVWEVVTDLSNQTWRSDLTRLEKVDENRFVEYTKDGIQTKFKVIKVNLHKIWEFEFENKNIQGTWIGCFKAHENETVLDFTENVTVRNRNAFLKPFVWFYLRNQQKQYFVDLEKELEARYNRKTKRINSL